MIARVLLVSAAVVGLSAGAASAATGVVKGKASHYLANGSFCPTGGQCSGANYVQSQFQTFAPIRNAKVFVYSGSTVAGTGTTDYNGNFTVQWNTTGAPSTGTVRFFGEQKDGRFALRTSAGGLYSYTSTTFTLTQNTTTTSPQLLADTVARWGSSGAPDAQLNLYEAGHLAYYWAMQGSNALYAAFTNVQLRGVYAVYNNDPDDCGTCGSGAGKWIRINQDYDFFVSGATHELGHVISYLLNPRDGTRDYCYNRVAQTFCTFPEGFCCGAFIGSHDFDSEEWGSVQFEEGFATAVAGFALYQASNTNPVVCMGTPQAACSGQLRNRLEPSTGLDWEGTACGYQRRWELSISRMLWDIYDYNVTNVEVYNPSGPTTGTDTVSKNYWQIYDVLPQYAYGTGMNQEDEHLNSTRNNWDNRDGHSGINFYYNALVDPAGTPTPLGDVQWQMGGNCVTGAIGGTYAY